MIHVKQIVVPRKASSAQRAAKRLEAKKKKIRSLATFKVLAVNRPNKSQFQKVIDGIIMRPPKTIGMTTLENIMAEVFDLGWPENEFFLMRCGNYYCTSERMAFLLGSSYNFVPVKAEPMPIYQKWGVAA